MLVIIQLPSPFDPPQVPVSTNGLPGEMLFVYEQRALYRMFMREGGEEMY